MSTLFAQRRRLVCACYAQFLTSFCFDSSMTLQAVESYSVCFCMIKSKSGYTYCSFFILNLAIDIPKFVYKVYYM